MEQQKIFHDKQKLKHQATTTEDSLRNSACRRWKQTKPWENKYQTTGEEKTSIQSSTDSPAHNVRNCHIPINMILNTLSINVLNSPIKRHYMARWIKKKDLTICCLKQTHLIDRNKHWLRVKVWKKIYQANGPWEQAGLAILISDKVDFKLTLIKWNK
jgi:hypothetical protein